jgi:hypothetical protein
VHKEAGMAEGNRKAAKRSPKTAATAGAANVVAQDTRRVLPTQDWVAKVDVAHLNAVANIQKLAVSHFYTGLINLRKDFSRQVLFPPDQNQFPRELHGTAALPDGRPAASLAVSILPFVDASNATVNFTQTAVTDAQGQFSIKSLPSAFVRTNTDIALQFRGANGTETRHFSASQIGSLGIVGNVRLALVLTPLPQSIVASLAGLVGSLEQSFPEVPRPGTASNPISVKLGGCECPIKFDHDLPQERFRYSMLVRLIEPRTSILTETLIFRGPTDRTFFLSALRNSEWTGITGSQSTFVERVPVDQPISVDGFRDRIIGNENGFISEAETVPMAGTLGLGYVLHMAQQWESKGLSLGDLVYSLPLAPGEQQRVAVFEQRQTLSTVELESLDYDEQQQASQQSDASTQAVFNSGFAEHVRGSSHFSTQADSSSWGVAGGVGAILGPVGIGIGAGGGGGSSSSSGSSSNSLDGTRDYVSTAASQAHNSVERQASARRHAQRTGMRLSTASDTEQVTTKVITNNNRMHALTMQYWEVLRHFEVSTAIDGVTLVCFVPLEVVRFLPAGASLSLLETQVATRAQVLFRYNQIIKHADILRRWIPFQYRQGLAILEEFASNPRAVPAFASATEDIVNISLVGSFLPFEDVYVSVLTRRGTRLGPVRMGGAVPPLPDTVTDPTHAFQTKTQLVAELLKRRSPDHDITLTAHITLPSSVNPDDVVGFELSRSFRTLTYQLQPPVTDPVQALLNGTLASNSPFISLLLGRLEDTLNGVTMAPAELEQELGGPSVWGFSAGIVGPPVESYASNFIGRPERFELPANGYPVAAQAVAPLLKFNQLLRIEQVLQHVVRNTITYSRAVWSSLTPEERAIMLEGFTIGVPAGGIEDPTQHVPLLNCVANQVLGFYGNAMIMPFNIPAEVATRLSLDGANEQQPPRPFTTSEVQNALTQFHRTGFSPPVSHITLPTRGVLGEAVLGSCPSAEKIDLTRFWNWQDSPLPQAADIAGTTLNKGSTLVGATAPSTLTGLPSIVQNVNAPAADANTALQALIAAQNTKDIPNITGMDQLAALQGKTIDTAEKARADALARAQTLASQGLTSAGEIMKARADSQRADQQAQQQQQTQAQQKATQQQQQAVSTMRTNAQNYLSVADARPDQASANAYAAQIVQQLFGSQTVPLETASSLFNNYRKFQSGTSGPLTQGSTAFLTALGLL